MEIFAWSCNNTGHLDSEDEYCSMILAISTPIKQIACGKDHSLLLSEYGQVFSMGSNSDGKLGLSEISSTSSPVPIECLKSVNQVSCGNSHSLAVSKTGTAFAWGSGVSGALGLRTLTSTFRPSIVPMDETVLSVSCGGDFSGFLLTSGKVAMCGSGDQGQLGHGKYKNEFSPVTLPLKDVLQIACGASHSLFLDKKGRMFATGNNTYGQLGTGDLNNTNSPTEIQFLKGTGVTQVHCARHSACINSNGTLFLWGASTIGVFLVPTPVHGKNICKVSVGATCAVAVDSEGNSFAWGESFKQDNSFDRVFRNKKIRDVSCGYNFLIAAKGIPETNRTASEDRGDETDRQETDHCIRNLQSQIKHLKVNNAELEYKLKEIHEHESMNIMELEGKLQVAETTCSNLRDMMREYSRKYMDMLHNYEKMKCELDESNYSLSLLKEFNNDLESSLSKVKLENKALYEKIKNLMRGKRSTNTLIKNKYDIAEVGKKLIQNSIKSKIPKTSRRSPVNSIHEKSHSSNSNSEFDNRAFHITNNTQSITKETISSSIKNKRTNSITNLKLNPCIKQKNPSK